MKTVGKVKEAHGLKGELKILIFSNDFSWTASLEKFELHSPQNSVAAFDVDSIRETPTYLIISSPQITDRTQAEKYRGWSFAVPEETFVSKPGETIFLGEILQFALQDVQGQKLGIVVGFGSNGFQDLLQIAQGENIFEVPFVEDFIKDIQFDNKILVMDLPPGLFDPELVTRKKP